MTLEKYFAFFRDQTIGQSQMMLSSEGKEIPLLYADWIASGRLYAPIEKFMQETVGPLVANTHTESTLSGTAMTRAYHQAREIIKRHVNASAKDSLFLTGFGMTAAVNKLQRILGLRYPEECREDSCSNNKEKPLVIITHMEHHSNQITWQECHCDLEIIPRTDQGLPDLIALDGILKTKGKDRRIIGAFSACSNVTGIITPYREMASLVHRYGGVCFMDFAASAPYVSIDMHPDDPEERLDAVLFSPHKFLGGPGTSGVLILNNSLYSHSVPDQPGGGTVRWTTPFGTHRYFDEIEVREDGGTPGFLQAMRIAQTIRLKEAMDPVKIEKREKEQMEILLSEMKKEPNIFLIEEQNRERIGIISFYSRQAHYNLLVRLLNDRFGIQTRGGCSCAGTYGHILFNIDKSASMKITDMIDKGDLSMKPGWVRISLHPTMTDKEVRYIGQSVVQAVRNWEKWAEDYNFDKTTGDFTLRNRSRLLPLDLQSLSLNHPAEQQSEE